MSILKRTSALLTAAAVSLPAAAVNVSAGWNSFSDGYSSVYKYSLDEHYAEDGKETYLTNCDHTIDGAVYHFDENGVCLNPPDEAAIAGLSASDKVEWTETEDGKICTVNGKKCGKGLHLINGVMYKFDESGICLGTYSGWTTLKTDKSKHKYYKNGTAASGFVKIKGRYYYFIKEIYSGDKYCKILEIKDIEVSPSEKSISFKLYNPTDYEVIRGEGFTVEKYINGKWEEFYSHEHNDIALGLSPKKSADLKANVDFSEGKYRIKYSEDVVSEPFTIS